MIFGVAIPLQLMVIVSAGFLFLLLWTWFHNKGCFGKHPRLLMIVLSSIASTKAVKGYWLPHTRAPLSLIVPRAALLSLDMTNRRHYRCLSIHVILQGFNGLPNIFVIRSALSCFLSARSGVAEEKWTFLIPAAVARASAEKLTAFRCNSDQSQPTEILSARQHAAAQRSMFVARWHPSNFQQLRSWKFRPKIAFLIDGYRICNGSFLILP